MKPLFRKMNKVSKGAPGGIVLHLLFHAGSFPVAGLFVVFTLVNKPEPEFKPPLPIERPAMKLPLEFTMSGNHYGFKYSSCPVLVFDQRTGTKDRV